MSQIDHNVLIEAMDDLIATTREVENTVARLRRMPYINRKQRLAANVAWMALHHGLLSAVLALRRARIKSIEVMDNATDTPSEAEGD